jgi:hypothetical protein
MQAGTEKRRSNRTEKHFHSRSEEADEQDCTLLLRIASPSRSLLPPATAPNASGAPARRS